MCYIYKPTELKVLELEERDSVSVPGQVQVELKQFLMFFNCGFF